jgi:hypothetical protein
MGTRFIPGTCASAGSPYAGRVCASYPQDRWRVGATAGDITREPKGRRLLDLTAVSYQTEAGAVLALYGRGPYRWAPLSSGWLEGDDTEPGWSIVGGVMGADANYMPGHDCAQSARPELLRNHGVERPVRSAGAAPTARPASQDGDSN